MDDVRAQYPWRVLSENGGRFSLVAMVIRLDLLIGQKREQT